MASQAAGPRLWKDDWDRARSALVDWWSGKGLALHVVSPRDEPWEPFPPVEPPRDLEQQWLDADHRVRSQLRHLARTFFGGVAFPHFDANIGPGSLGLFLGAHGVLEPETVWYEPCITDPEAHPPLVFDPDNLWFRKHVEIIRRALDYADGRFIVGMPDLIENLDTYAALRGNEETLLDLMERPECVLRRIDEINRAYFAAFEALEALIRTPWGGCGFQAFQIWGPGRTAKVQCDFSCMISPAMFDRFVAPALAEQAAWLDYTLYHLDGTNAIQHLDTLLAMPGLDAIEWTPQAGRPGGGSSVWYDLYRRIRAGGKAVQAVGVAPDEVLPLIDAVGAEGLFIMTWASTEREAHDLLRRVGWE